MSSQRTTTHRPEAPPQWNPNRGFSVPCPALSAPGTFTTLPARFCPVKPIFRGSLCFNPITRIVLLARVHDDARRCRRSFLSWEAADRPIAASRLSARLLPASKLYPVGSAFATPFPECSAPPDPQSRSAFPPRAWRPFSAGLSGLPRAERKLRGRPGEGKSGFITGSGEVRPPALAQPEDAGTSSPRHS